MSDLKEILTELTSGDDNRAIKAVHDLSRYGDTALVYLEELLTNPDDDIRFWVVRAIAAIKGGDKTRLLIRGFKDSNTLVQQCAAIAARENPLPGAIPVLVSLLDSSDRMLARLAADALVSIGEPSLPRLIETLETGTGNARVEAARVLAKIGDINTIPVLTKLLDEDSAIIGYWADAALEKMGIGMVYFDPG